MMYALDSKNILLNNSLAQLAPRLVAQTLQAQSENVLENLVRWQKSIYS
jgi:hypothetical protein